VADVGAGTRRVGSGGAASIGARGGHVGQGSGGAGRWPIALAAALIQAAVGTVYAWSVFRDPLAAALGRGISEVTLAYSINLFGLGVFAFLGGLWMQRVGPRTVGVAGGLLYGLGLLLTGLLSDHLWALYLGFGVLGGIGRGLAWVAPVATAVRWFPDRRGWICGISAAGNGLGALVAAPLATMVIDAFGVLPTFWIAGVGLLALVSGAALALREPPAETCPLGRRLAQGQAAQTPDRAPRAYTVGEALRTPQWYGLWMLLFVSSTAGLAVYSHAAPMARQMTGIGPLAAAVVVAALSLANTAGRLGWAWLSDVVGRRRVFVAMALLLAASLRALPPTTGVLSFTLLAATAMLCFGGGLGTLPAWATDAFGERHVGPIVGLLMTAQGCGAIVGPLLQAHALEAAGSYGPALSGLSVAVTLSALVPLAIRPPGRPRPRRQPVRVAARASR
jgi:OFA family oxalate/formate antiporter-like MFS transporter